MSFDDLKSGIRTFLRQKSKTAHPVQKMRVRERFNFVLAQQTSPFNYYWGVFSFYFQKSFTGFAFLAILIFSGVIQAPFLPNQVAGKIKSLSGVVEIIRGDERFLVRGETDLFVGDSVIVGHRGKAEIESDHVNSQLVEGSEIEIQEGNDIFLKRGYVKSETLKENNIKTERSLIQNPLGSAVEVYVSETGETTVFPLKNLVKISDSYEGQVELGEGEKLKISSDTRLVAEKKEVLDLNFSNQQLNEILGRLAISRTKLLKGLDLMVQGKRKEAFKSFVASEKSYLSIVQVLHTSRELKLLVPQNTKIIESENIHKMLLDKVENIEILTESKALNLVFEILEREQYSLGFGVVNTKSENFNKYTLLQYLVGMVEGEEKELLEYLANNYVIATLQNILIDEDKIAQSARLKKEFSKISLNKYGAKYKKALKEMLPENL